MACCGAYVIAKNRSTCESISLGLFGEDGL